MARGIRCPFCGAANAEGITRCRICTGFMPAVAGSRPAAGPAPAPEAAAPFEPFTPLPPPAFVFQPPPAPTGGSTLPPPPGAIPGPPPGAFPAGAPAPQGRPPAGRTSAKSIVGTVIGVVIGAVVAAGLAGVIRQSHTHAPPIAEWTTFREPSGAFSISLPSEPTRTTKSEQTSIGTITMILYECSYSDLDVGVAYADYGTAFAGMAVRAGLQGAAEGGAAAVHGKLLSTTYATVNGAPSVDFTVAKGSATVQARAILYGSRVYVLETTGDHGVLEAHQHLLQSFDFKS